MHADATNRMQQITRDLLQATCYMRPVTGDLLQATWRRSRKLFARSCNHNKTAKNRFALSFLCHSGWQKRRHKGAGT